MRRFLLPLIAFAVLVVFLAIGLTRDPRDVPSPLIGKPAPSFTLRQLNDPTKNVSSADMKGRVWLLNVWASWCVSCREEHPVLVGFSKTGRVPIIGLDYKDQDADGRVWLASLGNPYTAVAVDADGRVGIDYGVYGVPETYVIDKQGIIRMKHTGPVTPDALDKKILPLIESLSR
jgi:cytochrome c biogenesis protein CcmG/thiol:disulfide interchange protein DsbE